MVVLLVNLAWGFTFSAPASCECSLPEETDNPAMKIGAGGIVNQTHLGLGTAGTPPS